MHYYTQIVVISRVKEYLDLTWKKRNFMKLSLAKSV